MLVAHHQDDLLETYLLQKQRKQIPLTWGLSAVSVVDNLSVLRPLLDFTKDDLRTYCVKHHIQFGDDESNFTDIYTRNQLRHHVIDQLSAGQRQELLVEIAAANLKRSADSGLVQEAYQACFSPFNLDIYCKTAENIRIEALRKFLIHHHFPAKSYSPAYLQELDYLILKPGNHEVMLAEDRYLAKTYNNLVVYAKKGSAYCYEISELQWLKTPYFQIQETGSQLYGVTVSPRDFPLKIRSWQKSDQIELRLGHKRINRWFIDRKIPIDQRYRWPVVENSTHEIILVPKIGCNIAHFSNNPNMFVIKL
ncbi:tRNA(Ile)-lysidine synthase [bioreactor metagenome]|uniref:tRNA(Ile)-lysidine synthase n=1 Tax=bioreactor metagenome TaxID=1076179 RepID=A0A645BF89_9ZZZZ